MQTHNQKNKITVVAPLRTEKASLVSVLEALKLPEPAMRQPDLQYLTAILVSSGMNKNGAVFLGSELLKAEGTVVSKAMDIEHEERVVVGHITDRAFMKREGLVWNLDDMRKMSMGELDAEDMDVAVSCIVYKARFPEIAQDVLDGKWMVSMEAYYRDYDVKVGDLIIPREQAAKLGYDKLIGSVVKVKDGDKELGYHLVGRVLRDITFAGVGLVMNPANERSIILEAAAMNEFINDNKENASMINLADITTLEVADTEKTRIEEIAEVVRSVVREELDKALNKEDAEILPEKMRPGICVHYKRYLVAYPVDTLDTPPTDLSQYPLYTNPDRDAYPPGTKVVGEHGCNLFGLECTARPGDATKPQCWRNVFARTVREEITNQDYSEIVREIRSRDSDLVRLQDLIDEARKFKQ